MHRRRSHRRRLGPPTGISRGAGPGGELGCGCDRRASAALDLGGPRRSGSAFTRAPSSREALCSHYTRGLAGAGLLIRRSGDTPCVLRPFPAGRVAFHSVVLDKHQWNPPGPRSGGFRLSTARVGRLRGAQLRARARLVRHPARGDPAHQVRPGPRLRRLQSATTTRPKARGEAPRQPQRPAGGAGSKARRHRRQSPSSSERTRTRTRQPRHRTFAERRPLDCWRRLTRPSPTAGVPPPRSYRARGR